MNTWELLLKLYLLWLLTRPSLTRYNPSDFLVSVQLSKLQGHLKLTLPLRMQLMTVDSESWTNLLIANHLQFNLTQGIQFQINYIYLNMLSSVYPYLSWYFECRIRCEGMQVRRMDYVPACYGNGNSCNESFETQPALLPAPLGMSAI